MKKIEEIFIELAKIASPSGSEDDIKEYLYKWSTKIGFNVSEDLVGNLHLVPDCTPKIFLAAHMDTVEPGRGIKPLFKSGSIYSQGDTILGADNKVAIAAFIYFVEIYKSNNKTLPPIELIFSVKEEVGGGIDYFPFQNIKSPLGFIFDYAQPLGRIILSSPYIENFTIHLVGKPAHSSKPDQAINPLNCVSKIISLINPGKKDQGKTIINIGEVHSGTAINTIPGEAILLGEIRSFSQTLFLKYKTKIEKMVAGIAQIYSLKYEVSFNGYCPGYSLDKNADIVQIASKAFRNLCIPIFYDYSHGVSDANILTASGIKVLTLSDGVINPHTVDESIVISDLEKIPDIISQLLLNA